jgi:acetyl-CoA acyltransferase
MSREAVIVAACRTPVGRAVKGTTRDVRPDEMAAAVIGELLRRTQGRLDPGEIDDVILGCAFPEGDQGLNMARPVSLRAGLPASIPAMTINRFCSSGLQAIAIASERIIANGADVIIAGGVRSMAHADDRLRLQSRSVARRTYPRSAKTGSHRRACGGKYEVTQLAQDEFATAIKRPRRYGRHADR